MSKGLNKALEGEAGLIADFVNTHDLEERTDEISSPQQLADWISERAGEVIGPLEGEDVNRVLALRESLRALLRTHNGGTVEETDLQPLLAAAERSRYRPAFTPEGRLEITPARADLTGFEARVLLAVERLQAQAAWPRLKACTDDGCQWAFYDTTRNRSRTWCSMAECGNREKTRRYRERKSAA